VVESTALEMRRAGNGTVGSNPTLSAIKNRIATIVGGISEANLTLSATSQANAYRAVSASKAKLASQCSPI
jgi:hypothetical protein